MLLLFKLRIVVPAISLVALVSSPWSAPALAKTKAPVNISFWIAWSGIAARSMQNVVNEFNKLHPSIHVHMLPGQSSQKILTAITSGAPPDVGYVSTIPTTVQWAQAGGVESLTTDIRASHFNTKIFPPKLLAGGEYHHQIYSLPLSADTYLLFYNKTLFKSAGIVKPPSTWQQLQSDARKLTKTGPGGYQTLGFVPNFPWLDPYLLPSLFGAKLYNPKTHAITPSTPAMLQALNFERSFFASPYTKTQVQRFESGFGQYASPADPFFTGKLAMVWQGEWWPTYIHKYSPKLSFGTAPMPYPAGNPSLKNTAFADEGGIFIPRGAQYPRQAWTFVQWMMSTKAQVQFNGRAGGMPTTFPALKSPLLTKLNPSLKPFVNLMLHKHIVILPALPYTEQYALDLANQDQKVLNLQESAKQAMAIVQREMQSVVKGGQ